MRYLEVIPDLVDLTDLAGRIRKSSNFRFNWQFYRFHGIDPRLPDGIREALDLIIPSSELHRFLRESFQAFDDSSFETEPAHKHSVIARCDDFEGILAAGANDRLGAYSRREGAATIDEKREIVDLFETAGRDYLPYQLLPGTQPD